MSMEQVIDLSIQWGPTILFALIVLAGFLTGIRRGFRKSLLLALNALIAFVLVFLAYIWLVTNPNVDEYVVKYSNEVLAMLGQNNIQTLLGASENANSLKEILTEIIPQKMNLGEGIAAVIEENVLSPVDRVLLTAILIALQGDKSFSQMVSLTHHVPSGTRRQHWRNNTWKEIRKTCVQKRVRRANPWK